VADKIKVKIILGSTREGRFGERPARWIDEQLKSWEGVEAELLDLRDYPMPFMDSKTPPSVLNMQYPHEEVKKWSQKILDGDAYIIVSPEYNHGYPAVLKNAIDWLFPEWSRKPVGFVGYGSVSGARAMEQLREVVIELGMVPIKKGIHIGGDIIMKLRSEPNISDADLFASLRTTPGRDHLAIFMDELIWMARALKSARK
jgi:NAD(P)H-dependent FMN reductase